MLHNIRKSPTKKQALEARDRLVKQLPELMTDGVRGVGIYHGDNGYCLKVHTSSQLTQSTINRLDKLAKNVPVETELVGSFAFY